MVVGAGVSRYEEECKTQLDEDGVTSEEQALEAALGKGIDLNPPFCRVDRARMVYTDGLKMLSSDEAKNVAKMLLVHRRRTP